MPGPDRAGYSEADLAAAVAETKARQALGQSSVRAVSSLYDIPTTTLARHVANPDLSTEKGAGTVLSAEGEAALLDWITAHSSTQTSLSTADIRRKAAELEAHEAKEAGRDAHWSDGASWHCCCYLVARSLPHCLASRAAPPSVMLLVLMGQLWPAAGVATDGWWRSFQQRNNVHHHSTFTVEAA